MGLSDSLAIGMSMDVHVFVDDRPLVLGGVPVEHDRGLGGHSDGDVLLHAIMDAVLSACDLPDIGQLFPDTSDVNKGRSSVDMAREVARQVQASGARILSIDSVLICPVPKVAPVRAAIRESVADVFGVSPSKVNVKGRTYEGLGPLGEKQAVEARAVALVERGGA